MERLALCGRVRIPETRPGGEGAASIVVEGLRESRKNLRFDTMWQVRVPSENQKKLLAKVHPSCNRSTQHIRDASSMG